MLLYFILGCFFFLVFTPHSPSMKISNNSILASFFYFSFFFIQRESFSFHVYLLKGKLYTNIVLWLAWGQQSLFQPIKITITVRDTNRNSLLLVSSTTQMVWLKHLSFKVLYCTDCPLSTRIFTIIWCKTYSICMVVVTVCLPKNSMLLHSLLEAIILDVK